MEKTPMNLFENTHINQSFCVFAFSPAGNLRRPKSDQTSSQAKLWKRFQWKNIYFKLLVHQPVCVIMYILNKRHLAFGICWDSAKQKVLAILSPYDALNFTPYRHPSIPSNPVQLNNIAPRWKRLHTSWSWSWSSSSSSSSSSWQIREEHTWRANCSAKPVGLDGKKVEVNLNTKLSLNLDTKVGHKSWTRKLDTKVGHKSWTRKMDTKLSLNARCHNLPQFPKLKRLFTDFCYKKNIIFMFIFCTITVLGGFFWQHAIFQEF